MRKPIIIIVGIILAVIVLVGIIFALNFSNSKTKNNVIESDNKTIKTTSYEAKVYFDKDHYVLNVFTSNIEEKFSFEYDYEDFLLDTTGKVFKKAWKLDEDSNRKYVLDLEPNTLYEFNFIPLTEKELNLGENLIVK